MRTCLGSFTQHSFFFVILLFILYIKIPSDTFIESCRLLLYVYKWMFFDYNLFSCDYRININVRKKKVKQQIILIIHQRMLELFELVIIFLMKHLELEVLAKLKVNFSFSLLININIYLFFYRSVSSINKTYSRY